MARRVSRAMAVREAAGRPVGFRRAAAFAMGRSTQSASRSQIEPRYKAAKRRRLQAVLASQLFLHSLLLIIDRLFPKSL
jgi:hypothetical protein